MVSLMCKTPRSPLFPYTTLFRSNQLAKHCPRGHNLQIEGDNGGPLLIRILTEQIEQREDRKSTRLNSSHVAVSYADVCLKKNSYSHFIRRRYGQAITS